MNDKEYFEKILALCTHGEKAMFYRLYPDRPIDTAGIETAIIQIERTLRNACIQRAILREHKTRLENELEAEMETSEGYRNQLYIIEAKSKEEGELVPIAEWNDINERLRMLEALELIGVDEWEGWDRAIDIKDNIVPSWPGRDDEGR